MNIVEKILSYLIILLVIAIIYIQNNDFSDAKSNENAVEDTQLYDNEIIEALYPNYTSFSTQADSSCLVYIEKEQIAKLISSQVFGVEKYGYAGITPVLIVLDNDDKVDTIVFLENNETPTYVQFVEEEAFFDNWDNKHIDDIIDSDIETISGATFSSESIIETVNETVSRYTHSANKAKEKDLVKIFEAILFGFIIFLSLLLAFGKKLKKLRFVYMILVLLVMGFISKKMLSIDYFYSLLSGGFSLKANIQPLILLFLAIVIPILGKPKFYCNYLCPMGALQEVVGKLSPIKKKKNLNFKIFKNISIREIVLAIIWLSLIMGIVLPYAKLEPFSFFSISADLISWFFIVFAAVIIVLSVFFNKPWCSFCPTGCTLDTICSPLKKCNNNSSSSNKKIDKDEK